MRYSLVIFDCDGVLIDSEILSAECTAQVLTRLGVPMTAETAMRLFVGMTQTDVESAIERDFALTLPADFEQQATALLTQAYRDRLRPIDGVRDLVERLPSPFCVASNSPPAKLGLGLCLTDLFELFYPHIYCARLVARGKPAPDLFLYASGRFGVAPKDAIVIEDSVAGITAAKAAGMAAIGFTGGLHSGPASAARLKAAGADHIAETMADVSGLLGIGA